MPTLGTQNISTSYPQVLKTFGSNILDGTLRAIASGDEAGVSALQISTTGAKSTGTFAVDGATTLTGAVTLGSSFTASTGTATIGTLSASTATISTATIGTATISTATISTATIPLQLGTVTFGSSITSSTGTATIGTLSASTATISTATISTATIPTILGATTFATGFTSSTGTNTLGTIGGNIATLGTLSVTSGASVTTTATVGTAKIGASGPSLTAVSYGTAAFTSATAPQYNAAQTTNGTFALTGVALGDIVVGAINSLGSTTGTVNLNADFHVVSSGVVRYVINNGGTTAGTIPAGTIFATAMRFTA